MNEIPWDMERCPDCEGTQQVEVGTCYHSSLCDCDVGFSPCMTCDDGTVPVECPHCRAYVEDGVCSNDECVADRVRANPALVAMLRETVIDFAVSDTDILEAERDTLRAENKRLREEVDGAGKREKWLERGWNDAEDERDTLRSQLEVEKEHSAALAKDSGRAVIENQELRAENERLAAEVEFQQKAISDMTLAMDALLKRVEAWKKAALHWAECVDVYESPAPGDVYRWYSLNSVGEAKLYAAEEALEAARKLDGE